MRRCLYLSAAIGIFGLIGCNPFEVKKRCWPVPELATYCEAYDWNLLLCASNGSPRLPECHVEEQCTDFSDAGDSDAGVSTDNGTGVNNPTDDADTSSSTVVCKKHCVGGEMVPCDELSTQELCQSAYHCEWYEDNTF